MSTTWQRRLAEADISAREQRRPFDVADGLRRLAEEAGYVKPAPVEPRSLLARHRLNQIAHWTVTQAGAAGHVEELTAVLGESDGSPEPFNGWADIDTHGVHVFACTLYLANHPESAAFWWMFAAGAGHPAAAYSLHLLHLTAGEMREAAFWKKQIAAPHSTEGLINGLEAYSRYSTRHPRHPVTPTTELEQLMKMHERFEHHQNEGIVTRPDKQLPGQIDELAELR